MRLFNVIRISVFQIYNYFPQSQLIKFGIPIGALDGWIYFY